MVLCLDDLNNIVSQSKIGFKKFPYMTPAYFVKDNVTYLQVNDEKILILTGALSKPRTTGLLFIFVFSE